MKHDSYVRFLKSEQYKSCIMAAMEGKQLPYPGNSVDGSTVPDKVDDRKVHYLFSSRSSHIYPFGIIFIAGINAIFKADRTNCCCFVFLGLC